MVEHVRRRVLLAEAFSEVVVATCDKEISDSIQYYGGKVLMTSPDHLGATDRVAEAAQKIDCTHVVNVQGDEILVVPSDLKQAVTSIQAKKGVLAWNAIAPLNNPSDLPNRSIVKCVVSQSHRILYCSRDFSQLPFKDGFKPVQTILGILAYEKEFLIKLKMLKRTPGELLEGIDQNRIVENDILLQGILFSKAYPGINELGEVEIIERYLRGDKNQRDILQKILSSHSLSK